MLGYDYGKFCIPDEEVDIISLSVSLKIVEQRSTLARYICSETKK